MTIVFSLGAPKANKVVIDKNYLPDPFNYTLQLKITNQSLDTLYYRLSLVNLDNWSISSPSDGKLGAISGQSASYFLVTLQRAKPSTDVHEAGYLKLEAFTDQYYSNKVDEGQQPIDFYIEDLEAFTNVTIHTFQNDMEGWSRVYDPSYDVVDLVTSPDVEGGGHSVRAYSSRGNYHEVGIEKSVTLPSNSKVRLAFMWTYSRSNARFCDVKIYINGELVYDFYWHQKCEYGSDSGSKWYKSGVDISEYAGQEVTIRIVCGGNAYQQGVNSFEMRIDHIVIAGKD